MNQFVTVKNLMLCLCLGHGIGLLNEYWKLCDNDELCM